MQRGQTAHREPADVRPGDAERVEQALDVVGGLLLRVRFWILGHVGRRIAAGVERERTVAPREERRLQPPALRIAGELVDEHQRGALARLVIVELHASDRHFRHGHASLVFRLASDGGGPSPATSCGSHYHDRLCASIARAAVLAGCPTATPARRAVSFTAEITPSAHVLAGSPMRARIASTVAAATSAASSSGRPSTTPR